MCVLYGCMFPALLYSCEAWGYKPYRKDLLAIKREAFKSCLGVKQSTPNYLIYAEVIKDRQYNLFQKFSSLDENDAIVKNIWNDFSNDDSLNVNTEIFLK